MLCIPFVFYAGLVYLLLICRHAPLSLTPRFYLELVMSDLTWTCQGLGNSPFTGKQVEQGGTWTAEDARGTPVLP
jgi:hypothetical protein